MLLVSSAAQGWQWLHTLRGSLGRLRPGSQRGKLRVLAKRSDQTTGGPGGDHPALAREPREHLGGAGLRGRSRRPSPGAAVLVPLSPRSGNPVLALFSQPSSALYTFVIRKRFSNGWQFPALGNQVRPTVLYVQRPSNSLSLLGSAGTCFWTLVCWGPAGPD